MRRHSAHVTSLLWIMETLTHEHNRQHMPTRYESSTYIHNHIHQQPPCIVAAQSRQRFVTIHNEQWSMDVWRWYEWSSELWYTQFVSSSPVLRYSSDTRKRVLFKYRLNLTLKIEGCHDANFFVSSDIDRSLRWCQWWQCWHHDNSRFTVYCNNSICEEYSHPQMTLGNFHLVGIF